MRRKRRVRLHLIEDGLPSLEGILIGRRPEYLLAAPVMHTAPEAQPVTFADARLLAVPRDRVAFIEIL